MHLTVLYSRAVLRLHTAEGLLAAAPGGPGPRQRRGGQQGLYKHYNHDVIYLKIDNCYVSRTTLSPGCTAPESGSKSGTCSKTQILRKLLRYKFGVLVVAKIRMLTCTDSGDRVLAVPAGLHLHAHPLHHPGVPGEARDGQPGSWALSR